MRLYLALACSFQWEVAGKRRGRRTRSRITGRRVEEKRAAGGARQEHLRSPRAVRGAAFGVEEGRPELVVSDPSR